MSRNLLIAGAQAPRSRTGWKLAATALVGALALSGCAGGGAAPTTEPTTPTSAPVQGGTLNVAAPGDPRSFDPVASAGPLTARYAELMFEGLFASDKDFVPRPMLVDTYETNEAQTEYTFKLRKGVLFHDGTELTSADVVASLNRFFAKGFAGRAIAVDIASVSATDEYTVVISLTRPRFPLISELAGPAAQIFKASSVTDIPDTGFVQEQAIGTGPYQLASWDAGKEVVLTSFAKYQSRSEEDWGGFAGAKHTYLETLNFKIVTDPNAQVSGLQTGQWDYIQPNIDQFDVLSADKNLTVTRLAGANLNVVSVNQSDASIFNDVRAREALNLVMDRAAIVAAKGGNETLTNMSPSLVTSENTLLYNNAGEEQYKAHDLERAKKLFAEAGLAEGGSVKIIASTTFPWLQQTAVMVQAQLQEIGINATIDSYDWVTQGKVTEVAEGWDIAPIFFNAVVTSPGQMRVLKDLYKNSFSSPEMDNHLATYNAAKSDQEASKAFSDLQGYLWKQWAYPIIDTTHEYAAHTPKLQGYGGFYYLFWNSWLAE